MLLHKLARAKQKKNLHACVEVTLFLTKQKIYVCTYCKILLFFVEARVIVRCFVLFRDLYHTQVGYMVKLWLSTETNCNETELKENI